MTQDESRTHADEKIVEEVEQTIQTPSRPRVYIPLTLDRRTFVRGGGASVAAAAWGRSAAGQATRTDVPEDPVTHLANEDFADVMDRPDQIPSPNSLQSLSPHEADTVDAITSRIMPGTTDDPGAHEAGVVTYIDALLAYNEGYAEFTYLQGPFAQTEASLASAAPGVSGTTAATPGASPQASPVANGATPMATPEAPAATPGMAGGTEPEYDVVMVDGKDIQRYGYQSRLSPRDVYRIGIAALDRHTSDRFGAPFKDLHADQQDEVIGDMAKGNISSFAPNLSAQSFFQNLRRHTGEGMFSDPAYGGNRDMVGWKLIGFPGAQRAYMPIEFQTEGTDRQPQSMDQLHPFNPGQAPEGNDNVILPVSGSDREHKDEDHP